MTVVVWIIKEVQGFSWKYHHSSALIASRVSLI